jgi:TPR repeat protein
MFLRLSAGVLCALLLSVSASRATDECATIQGTTPEKTEAVRAQCRAEVLADAKAIVDAVADQGEAAEAAGDWAAAARIYRRVISPMRGSLPIYAPRPGSKDYRDVVFGKTLGDRPASAKAQWRLSQLHASGRGVRQDLKQACKLAGLAASELEEARDWSNAHCRHK